MIRRKTTRGPAGFALLISRRGFTLLEMILALSIGLLVMWCFYSVLSYQAEQAQSGRRMLQETQVARGVFTTIANNIQSVLPPINAFVQPSSTSSSTATTDPATTSTTTPFVFNNMVYGANNYLVLTVSKVPRELNLSGALGKVASADPNQQASVSDLRRVSFWMEKDGLAIQEVTVATSNDIGTSPPTLADAGAKIFAPEVKDISFQYFDGISWQDSWDGTTLGGPNSNVPIGPPAAISITISFFRHAPDGSELPDEKNKFTFEVAVPCGNNFPQTSNQ